MGKTCYCYLLISLLAISSVCGQNTHSFNPKKATYLWPNDAGTYLSSTFAETRAGHFHAALDLKTWGRRGYHVYATRGGIVYRIAMGPRGYGRVIYLKHPDGSFSVYAHLLSFNKKLQHLADSIRITNNFDPQFDRVIEKKRIHVNSGDLIGISGASGIGPPHIHFELRTPSNKPFNPLLTNLSKKINDTSAPRMVAISVEPLSFRSSIEGKKGIFTERLHKHRNHHYRGKSITAAGPIGLGIRVFDQANRVHNVYAVYRLRMWVDGQPFFKAQADSFSYKETRQMYIDRAYPLLQNSGNAFQRLYVADGNSLPFYSYNNLKGKLNLPPGRHHVVIKATDFYGNQSTASVRLQIKKSEPEYAIPSSGTPPKKSSASVSLSKWHWFDNWLTLPENSFRKLTVASTDTSSFIEKGPDVSINLRKLSNLFMKIPDLGPIEFQRKTPDSKSWLYAFDRQSWAQFPKGTFYDSVSVGITARHFSSDSIEANILPEAYPLHGAYRFFVKRDDSIAHRSQVSFYYHNRKYDSWYPINTTFKKGLIVGKTRLLGQFITLRDSVKPEIKNPRLKKWPNGQKVVLVNVSDNLSGIDGEKTKMWINDKQGIAEYAPEDHHIIYYKPNFYPSHPMDVRIVIQDHAGNRTDITFSLP